MTKRELVFIRAVKFKIKRSERIRDKEWEEKKIRTGRREGEREKDGVKGKG